MRRINSREFQGTYHKLREPVEVYRRSELLGTWYPVEDQRGDHDKEIAPDHAALRRVRKGRDA